MKKLLAVSLILILTSLESFAQDAFSQIVAAENAKQQQNTNFAANVYNKVTKSPETMTESVLGVMFRMFEKNQMGTPLIKIFPSRTKQNIYEIYYDYFKTFKQSNGVTIIVEVALVSGRPLVLGFYTKDVDVPTGGVSWGTK